MCDCVWTGPVHVCPSSAEVSRPTPCAFGKYSWIAPFGCCRSCVRPATGSFETTTRGAAPLRATEIVFPFGDSKETSSVPALVRSIDGTTMFVTPPETVVHAAAAGASTSAASVTAAQRTT